ncbi:MAG: Diaminopimelate decarboxylase, partial [uncultured Corynebacteriales bacterium]
EDARGGGTARRRHAAAVQPADPAARPGRAGRRGLAGHRDPAGRRRAGGRRGGRAGAGRHPRHPGVRAGRARLPDPLPGLRRRLRRRGRALRGQGVLLAGRAALDHRGGPRAGRLLGRRAGRGAAGRGAAGADRAARQQQVDRGAGAGAGRRRRPGRRRLVRRDRPAGLAGRRPRGPAAGAGPGHRRGRGAHPRVHRDRARGPEVRLLGGGRGRLRGLPAGARARLAGAGRGALAHRLADLRHLRLRGLGPAGGRAAGPAAGRAGRLAGVPGPRRRVRHRVHRRRHPHGRARAGRVAARDRGPGVPGGRAGRAQAGGGAGPGDRRAGLGDPLRGRDGQGRPAPPVRLGRRRDERQHPHRAVRRPVHLRAGLPGRRVRAGAVPGGRQTLRERRHRRPRHLAARRPGARRPGRGGRDRGVLPLAGQQLQPPAAPAGGGRGRRRGPGRGPPGDRRGPAPAGRGL